ncbi:MAG TPA: precorrin-4 C(11)-methyltransferase [Lachnospiraceae bacterium]|nr:precorrin-4 C(11)-methyltransferase [Lachnospiraceae bacterium]
MVYFVGAGSGAADLITVRGYKLLQNADVIIYAGSLVNPELLECKKAECQVYNSAFMTLEEVIDVMKNSEEQKKTTVRLHTGDPSIYGAIKEQFDELDKLNIHYEVCPGVSSLFGAASSLKLEYTLPNVSQTVIVTRMEGRTPVPEKERIEVLASHGATMVIFLSTGMLEELSQRLIQGGYTADTPAAIVYKATWADEKKINCTISTLSQRAKEENITKTALIIIGDVLKGQGERSLLYDPNFTTEFRQGK